MLILFVNSLYGSTHSFGIILVIVLLFGGRKIPELMKGLGQGMKEFKKARNEDKQEEKTDTKAE